MAKQLDLEEQEQLDELKHFWKSYGNAITWALIVVLGAFASWNFYQYWQRSQATQAAAMFDEVERVVTAADAAKIDRAFADMKDRFAATTYAHQAGLLVAKHYYDVGNVDAAKSALTWVVDKSSDPGYQAVAKLRLAGLLMDSKAFDEALTQLSGSFPASFEALVADRKGDILLLQGKKQEAIAEYEKAFKSFDQRTEYRRLVEVKLNSLGVDPFAGSPAAGSTNADAGPVANAPISEGTK
ncbi:MAG: tetratricopeptide repeat protein [Rhodoferax sp.]|uniref:YfgM family protein n=1 Tax=Rhodoferax sp. TaxID=50421 RepID=UPI0013FF9EA5|nr:tetratricopeptide repeat protein [Rhodoferax sp.]NDP37782.1 tetratricopeptide repeat protein [Rhodoferax sp.]